MNFVTHHTCYYILIKIIADNSKIIFFKNDKKTKENIITTWYGIKRKKVYDIRKISMFLIIWNNACTFVNN